MARLCTFSIAHILLEQWSADSCCVFQVWSDNGFIEVAEHVMVHVYESSKDYSQVFTLVNVKVLELVATHWCRLNYELE